jgi:hypothetical protein
VLVVRDNDRVWRVPLQLEDGVANGYSAPMVSERDGVSVGVTGVATIGDELAVELEVRSAYEIRQVAAPLPTPVTYSRDDPRDFVARLAEFRRVFGDRADQLVLESDGQRVDEMRRVFLPDYQQFMSDGVFISKFTAIFPRTPLEHATLRVPFVALNDREPQTVVDLSDLPQDVELGVHGFRVVRIEPVGNAHRIVLQLLNQERGLRFVQPMRVYADDETEFGWQAEALAGDVDLIAMTTRLGAPPMVRFQGAVMRVDGPWLFALANFA